MEAEGIKKLYYSISEVSEQLGLEPYVLRFWETEFEILNPRKNRGGRRVYTEADIEVVARIKHLLREEKYTIEGARQVLERGRETDGPPAEQVAALKDLRAFLADLLERL